MAINNHTPVTSNTPFGPFYRGGPEAECFAVRPGQSLEEVLQFAQSYIGHTLNLIDVFRNDVHGDTAIMEDRFLALEAMLTPSAALISASLAAISQADAPPTSPPANATVGVESLSGLEQATMILDQVRHMTRAIANDPHPESIDELATTVASAQSLVDGAIDELRKSLVVVPSEHT